VFVPHPYLGGGGAVLVFVDGGGTLVLVDGGG
jgi:hypothetical protein